MLFDIGQRARVAAPIGGDRRTIELLAEQLATERRQVRNEAGALHDGAAHRIDDGHIASTHRLQEARDTCRAIGPNFERIARIVLQPAQDDIDRLQPAQCFQTEPRIAHREILRLDQRQAEILRDEGLFEIGLCVGT